MLFVDTDGDLVVKGDINAKTLSTGSKTSSATGQDGLFIDSNGNLYSGSNNQTIIYANGEFTFGGENGISFDGTNITLGSDCTISWNRVADKPDIATTSQIPTKVSQLNNDSNFQNATQVTTITENTISTTNVLAQNLRVTAAKIDGQITASQINTTGLKAGSVDAENITGTTISGKTISGGTISGSKITGVTGSIGGFEIGSNSLYSPNSNIEISKKNIYISSSSDPAKYAFYAFTEPSKCYACIRSATYGLYWGYLQEELDFIDDNIHKTGWGIYAQASLNIQTSNTLYIDSSNQIDLNTSQCHLVISGDYDHFFPSSNGTTLLGTSGHRWGQIYSSNTTISSSDIKNKDVIGSIDFAEDLIMSLSPTTFMWKDGDHRRTRMGFIAQDVAEVCKTLEKNLSVVTASYIEDENRDYFGEEVDDSKLTWGISYEQLIAPMVAVIQNQERRIAQLESIINKE